MTTWRDGPPRDANGNVVLGGPKSNSLLGTVNTAVTHVPLVGEGLGALEGLATPQSTDTTALKTAQQKAADTQDYFHNQLVNLPAQYNPGQQQQLYQQGQGAITDLTAASRGLVPSAAEMMLHQQGAANAAQQFGQAAALQGRSPGMALRQAQIGAAGAQAATNAQAAQLRAQEQAQARGQLVQAIGGQQQAVQGVRTGDLNAQQNLIQGDLSALHENTAAATGVTDANAKDAASKNAFKGGLIGAGVSYFKPTAPK